MISDEYKRILDHMWEAYPLYYLPDGTKLHGLLMRKNEYICLLNGKPVWLLEE
jgi:hypothetical protein